MSVELVRLVSEEIYWACLKVAVVHTNIQISGFLRKVRRSESLSILWVAALTGCGVGRSQPNFLPLPPPYLPLVLLRPFEILV